MGQHVSRDARKLNSGASQILWLEARSELCQDSQSREFPRNMRRGIICQATNKKEKRDKYPLPIPSLYYLEASLQQEKTDFYVSQSWRFFILRGKECCKSFFDLWVFGIYEEEECQRRGGIQIKVEVPLSLTMQIREPENNIIVSSSFFSVLNKYLKYLLIFLKNVLLFHVNLQENICYQFEWI